MGGVVRMAGEDVVCPKESFILWSFIRTAIVAVRNVLLRMCKSLRLALEGLIFVVI
jgi:hypothetical protein